MSWEDQGRQEHGWFGHGTAPPRLKDNDASGRFGSTPEALEQRIRAMGMSAIAAMPQRLRYHHAVHFPGPVMEQLVGAVRAWVAGVSLDRAEFARRFLGASPSWPAVEHLREAARLIASARSPADMMAATDQLAAGMREVGLDQWRRFLANAQQRAASSSAVSASSRSTSGNDHLASPAPSAAPSSLETMFTIDTAYRMRLGRGASAAEMAASKQMLADGASLHDLRAAIGAASVFMARQATLVAYAPSGSVTPPIGALVEPYKEGYVPLSQVPVNARGILKYRVFFYDKGTGTYKVGFSFPNNAAVLPTRNKQGLEVGFTVTPPDSPSVIPGSEQDPISGIRGGFRSNFDGKSYFKVFNAERQMISPVTGKTVDNTVSHYPIDLLRTFLQRGAL